MLLTRYAQIATTQDKKTTYLVRQPLRSRKPLLTTPFQDFARSQLDYALGNNPMSGAPSTPSVNVKTLRYVPSLLIITSVRFHSL